ncbi:MAG: hypothetical protein J6C81_09020 [Muribaculaceae bacterium]|nr:hypothetical protein [Muribaculaceae bacterium]
MKSRKKLKSYVWVPAFLTVYALAMALFNLDNLKTADGRQTFWFTVGVEVLLIVLVAVFLKKRDKYRMQREESMARQEEQNRYKISDKSSEEGEEVEK